MRGKRPIIPCTRVSAFLFLPRNFKITFTFGFILVYTHKHTHIIFSTYLSFTINNNLSRDMGFWQTHRHSNSSDRLYWIRVYGTIVSWSCTPNWSHVSLVHCFKLAEPGQHSPRKKDARKTITVDYAISTVSQGETKLPTLLLFYWSKKTHWPCIISIANVIFDGFVRTSFECWPYTKRQCIVWWARDTVGRPATLRFKDVCKRDL